MVNAHQSEPLNGKLLSFRSLKNLTIAKLKANLAFAHWCSLECIGDLDDTLTMFNSLLMDIWYCHAPIKHRLVRMKSAPKMTDKVLDAIRIRNFAYKCYIASRTLANFSSYKLARNIATDVIFKVKRALIIIIKFLYSHK